MKEEPGAWSVPPPRRTGGITIHDFGPAQVKDEPTSPVRFSKRAAPVPASNVDGSLDGSAGSGLTEIVGAGGPPQDRVVFTIDLTKADGLFSAGKFQIQSGDLVYVTESPLGTATTLVGIFANVALARQRLQQ